MIRFRVIVAVFAAAFSCGSRAASAADKPNIVIILADDLGNADLGYRGSKIKTPNIDILAKGGVRLESYYGLPLCTPARAALMTGRYPMRHGLQTLVIFPSHKYGLPVDEKTLPQALKQIGYSTYMSASGTSATRTRSTGRIAEGSTTSMETSLARSTTSRRTVEG